LPILKSNFNPSIFTIFDVGQDTSHGLDKIISHREYNKDMGKVICEQKGELAELDRSFEG